LDGGGGCESRQDLLSAPGPPLTACYNTRMAILMVDDDQELCALMREFLEREGFALVTELDGAAGLRRILETPFDLVVLDVMLPSLDGFEVLRRVRRRSDVPVILLTARGGPTDRLEGFDAGADDYLPKPFAPAELLARMRAVLRRTEGGRRAAGADLQVGPIRVAPSTRQAWRDGQPLDLTDTELEILELLVRASGRVVARDEIFSALYQRQPSPFERSVDVHVSHLRKKLGADGDRLVRTVRGVGYQFSETP
jgi:two-component system response regulator CpxR